MLASALEISELEKEPSEEVDVTLVSAWTTELEAGGPGRRSMGFGARKSDGVPVHSLAVPGPPSQSAHLYFPNFLFY